MHNAVHLVHHEDAEKHIIGGNPGNKSEDSDRQKDDTKKHSECFNHCETSYWFKTLRLWQFAAVAGKRKRGIVGNAFPARVSKIENMRVIPILIGACLALMVDLSLAQSSPAATKSAVFAGGCFWCIQPAFDKAPGVIKTTVGYCGGTEPNPTYELVGSEKTNYRESIEIVYDPAKISYEQLLDIYWKQIDPTQSDGQFTDIGPSYRAAIFYGNEEEEKVAEASKEKLARSGKFKKPIVTEILPAMKFYPAEDYHQKYYQQNPEHFEAFEHGSGRVSFQKKTWGEKR